jgi:hypothetical protein
VGSNNRYDRDRPVTSREADEARALHTLGEVVSARPMMVLNQSSILQIAAVMHAMAVELNNGRPVALGVRGAVLRMANALRESLDPRPDVSPSEPDETESDETGPDAPEGGQLGAR